MSGSSHEFGESGSEGAGGMDPERSSARLSAGSDRERTADALARSQPLLRDSICLSCLDHRTIVSGRGSVFMLCQSQPASVAWPKYPRQPVIRCDFWRCSSDEMGLDDTGAAGPPASSG